jgi:O-antigen ligase
MDRLKAHFPISDRSLFWCFGALVLVCLGYSILNRTFLPLAIPFSIPLVMVLLTNYHLLYYLLIFSLPFSMEFSVGGSLTSDLPSEPLMVLLMACFIGSLLSGTRPDPRFFRHPLVIMLSVMYLWAVFTTFFSVDATKSIKYLLAKAWYIVPFLLLTGAIVKDLKDIRRILWMFLLPVSVLVVFVLLRHFSLHFAFNMVQRSITPFFKNHVIYATALALFIPYVITLFLLEKRAVIKLFLIGVFGILILGVIFSYTRASWLSLPLAGMYYLAIRFKLTKIGIVVAYAGVIFAAGYLINQNKFMLYAPDYESTIFNGQNLEKHLQATYNMEDISGMERVYRWVAVFYMAHDNPVVGSGPSTFYPEYRKYTVRSFRTYVSDNPEHSTTHNYFLLQLAEQGFIGLVLFMTFVAMVLVIPQTLYHRTRNPELRAVIIGAGLCLVIIIWHLTLNELLEVEKVGSFFFISIALLIKLDIWTKEEKQGLLEAAGK